MNSRLFIFHFEYWISKTRFSACENRLNVLWFQNFRIISFSFRNYLWKNHLFISNNLKNRLDPEAEEAVVKTAFEYPAFGQQGVCNELRKKDIFISAGGVRSVGKGIILRFWQALKALEARVAQDGLILSEAQLMALEKKKVKKEVCGEIETEHSGYLEAQDTYYVVNIKACRWCAVSAINRFFEFCNFLADWY